MPFPTLFNRQPKPAPSGVPSGVPETLELSAPLDVTAKASGDSPARFSLTAYTGGPLNLEGFAVPVVIDLQGASFDKPTTPVIFDHDTALRIGHTSAQKVDASGIHAEGVVSSSMGIAAGFVEDAKRGFPFQVSVGATIVRGERIEPGETVSVNGRDFNGPCIVANETTIRELSVCVLGADNSTSALVIAASQSRKGNLMPSTYNPTAHRQQLAEEERRVDSIRAVASRFANLQSVHIDGQSVSMADAKAHAIAEGWSSDQLELHCRRASYGGPSGPGIHSAHAGVTTPEILEAAVAKHAGLRIAAHYPSEVCESADHVGVRSLMDAARLCVEASGQRVGRGKDAVIRAAFSTHDFTTLLANVAHKTALDAYNAYPSAARVIATTLTAEDFHTHSGIRMGGDIEFQEMAPDGTISHGSLSDQTYTFTIDTYSRMLGIDRKALVNDDLQMLADVPKALGRGCAVALERTFFQTLLGNGGAFFSLDNGNLISGAGSALSSTALSAAIQKLMEATDPDGYPISLAPKYLLVAPANYIKAKELVASVTLAPGGGNTDTGRLASANGLEGMLEVVVSPWIGTNNGIGGGDDNAFYVLADPTDAPATGTAFLEDQQQPTIEPVDPPSNVLGQQWRGYLDWGHVLIDTRAIVKSTGV